MERNHQFINIYQIDARQWRWHLHKMSLVGGYLNRFLFPVYYYPIDLHCVCFLTGKAVVSASRLLEAAALQTGALPQRRTTQPNHDATGGLTHDEVFPERSSGDAHQ